MENRLKRALLLIFVCLATPLLWANVPLKIEDQRLSADRLVLEFNRPLSDREFRSFHLRGEDGLFRRVVDVQTDFPERFFSSTGVSVPGVRIAQFDPQTARIVLYHPEMFNISVKTWQNKLIVDIDAPGLRPYRPSATTTPSPPTPPPQERPQPARVSQYQPTVVIDAGHGGRDNGASNGRILEKNIVLPIAKMVAEALEKKGFKVVMTRDRDVYVHLQDRTSIANRARADVFVSIHANANPLGPNLQGLETYFLSPARSERAKEVAALENSVVVENMTGFSQEAFLNFLNRELVVASNKLAIDIQRGMLISAREKFSEVQDNGVREGPFWVLVGAQMPSVLVEVGYLTNAEDRKRLTNAAYQRQIALGIANGVENFIFNQMGGR